MTAGRPRLYATDEERRVAHRARVKEKYRNISIDADLGEALNIIADKLEPELGFRPKLSQVIRYLISKAVQ